MKGGQKQQSILTALSRKRQAPGPAWDPGASCSQSEADAKRPLLQSATLSETYRNDYSGVQPMSLMTKSQERQLREGGEAVYAASLIETLECNTAGCDAVDEVHSCVLAHLQIMEMCICAASVCHELRSLLCSRSFDSRKEPVQATPTFQRYSLVLQCES